MPRHPELTARSPRHVRRWVCLGLALAAALVLAAIGAGSWAASSVLLVPKHDPPRADVAVLAVRAGEVELARTAATARPGEYGLEGSGVHAIAGPIVAQSSSSVTRRLLAASGALRAGGRVAVTTDVYSGDPMQALGIPFQDVSVPGQLGPMPAWVVPGSGTTWAIFVHGIDGDRGGGLRVLPALHSLGLPAMLITYRNDVGAPRSPDGLIHLGMTEWQDLQAAVQVALGRGARQLVLVGDSMGGAIVTRFLRRSPLASWVSRVVLDAPALDWQSILAGQAGRLHVPFLAGTTEAAIQLRIGIDWASMNEIAHARDFRVPILLFQGLDDPLVPPADSAAFARDAPGPTTFVTVPGAGHVQSWNVDPVAYDARVRAFLSAAA